MGLEFYGEQGIEGIHSEFNTHSQHFDHVKKQDVRLRQILVNHHIATSPSLTGKAPKPKERNLKRKANEQACPFHFVEIYEYILLTEVTFVVGKFPSV